MEVVMEKSLRRWREFTVHGLIKVRIAHKKATKARPGRNPATGEAIMISAKPAKDVVRVRALKRVKDLA
jgi:nucleoid DNA-binding protein